MCDKVAKIPNNLIKRCRNKSDVLTYNHLAVYVKLKLESDSCVRKYSTSSVSKKYNINYKLLSETIPILQKYKLVFFICDSLNFLNDKQMLEAYNDDSYVNQIDFSKCITVVNYADMLRISLVNLKISQINYSIMKNNDPSRDITNDSFIKNYIPNIDPDVNKCMTMALMAKTLGEKRSAVQKFIERTQLKGVLKMKVLVYHVSIEDHSIEIKFGRKILPKNPSNKVIVKYGSVFEVSSVKTEQVKEEYIRYVKR